MQWSDFLKYSKYIAVFYAIAFIIGICGIWMQPHGQWMWTAVMFFGAALASNVALGFYNNNHKGSLLISKQAYLAEQGEAQVVTGEGKTVALPGDADAMIRADLDHYLQQVAEKAHYKGRGY